jgi:hypothetical protein
VPGGAVSIIDTTKHPETRIFMRPVDNPEQDA